MKVIISIECNFKTNKEKIENILQHYGLRKIQNSLYIGNLDKNERKDITDDINQKINEKDNVLIIPICQSCYLKKEICGRKIKFENELYKVF